MEMATLALVALVGVRSKRVYDHKASLTLVGRLHVEPLQIKKGEVESEAKQVKKRKAQNRRSGQEQNNKKGRRQNHRQKEDTSNTGDKNKNKSNRATTKNKTKTTTSRAQNSREGAATPTRRPTREKKSSKIGPVHNPMS